jgi:hypothetical protein
MLLFLHRPVVDELAAAHLFIHLQLTIYQCIATPFPPARKIKQLFFFVLYYITYQYDLSWLYLSLKRDNHSDRVPFFEQPSMPLLERGAPPSSKILFSEWFFFTIEVPPQRNINE